MRSLHGSGERENTRRMLRTACRDPFSRGRDTDEPHCDFGTPAPLRRRDAADTGHITVHEAGAIEAGGHKVLALPHTDGKLTAHAIEGCLRSYRADTNRDHMVCPGMVYLSHPTEYGTLYTMNELEAISAICRANKIPLFLDGARLVYALGCSANELMLAAVARLTDVFYIDGTKCGALLGEAVVFPKPNTMPHFFTIVKQNGALLAKGRVLGIQFDTLFTDMLYERGGKHAIAMADRIRTALTEKGYHLVAVSPTNQIFLELNEAQLGTYQNTSSWGSGRSRAM